MTQPPHTHEPLVFLASLGKDEPVSSLPHSAGATGTLGAPGANFVAMLGGVRLPFDPALSIPTLHRIRLATTPTETIVDVRLKAATEIVRRFTGVVSPGDTVAVGAGSRGLTGRVEMLAGVIDGFHTLNALPFVVPAMGSHGGGTAEGQREVLTGYGITEEAVGAEIRSTMETEVIARTANGMPMYLDHFAAQARFFFPVNRIKPHTCFVGPLESGLSKMAVVGFGKQPGAAQIHAGGPEAMRDVLLDGIVALRRSGRLLGGLATIENGAGDVVAVEALMADEIGAEREVALTNLAKSHVPRLPFEDVDVLIVEQVGKDISGVGIDPNVSGRYWVNGLEGEATSSVIVVLGLTEASHGNALGIGLADFTTVAVASAIDWHKTYVNSFTAGPAGVRRSRMPMVLPTDDDAIKAALSMCGKPIHEPKRVVRIHSTLHLTEISVSDALLSELPPGATLL